jgi:hypothetical protein
MSWYIYICIWAEVGDAYDAIAGTEVLGDVKRWRRGVAGAVVQVTPRRDRIECVEVGHLHIQLSVSEQLLHRIVKRFRWGLVLKAHRLVYDFTLGSRVMKKKNTCTKRRLVKQELETTLDSQVVCLAGSTGEGYPLGVNRPSNWHPTPYTVHPTPYTVHRTPCTLHPTPCTLHRTPYTVHPTPYTLHRTPYTVHRTPYTLHRTPYTVHRTPYTLHPTHYTLHRTPYTLHPTRNASLSNNSGEEPWTHRLRASPRPLPEVAWGM